MAKKTEAGGSSSRGFYKAIKSHRHSYDPADIGALLAQTNKDRVEALSEAISTYIVKNLPEAIDRREGLAAYRTNPLCAPDVGQRNATRRFRRVRELPFQQQALHGAGDFIRQVY